MTQIWLNCAPDVQYIDGLELSYQAKNMCPNIRIMLLSGYEDFNYAKEAISLGVEEYFVKPVVIDDLLKEMSKVVQDIVYKSIIKIKSSNGIDLLRQEFFNRILQSSLSDYQKDLSDLNLHFKENGLLCILIEIYGYEHLYQKLHYQQIMEIKKSIQQKGYSILELTYCVIDFIALILSNCPAISAVFLTTSIPIEKKLNNQSPHQMFSFL